MSTTDLLNGSVESEITYNIKDNCSVFEANNFNMKKINYFRSVLLAIAFNSANFLNIVMDFRNLSRSYYNQAPKKFCSTIKYDAVQYNQGKWSTVMLEQQGGNLTNTIRYIDFNGTTKINLLKVLQPNKLPVCWSNIVGEAGVCQNDATFNPALLSEQEKILYYYIKHADFFTKMLDIMTRSFYKYSEFIYFNYTIVLPEDLYPGSKSDRTLLATNQFLKEIYSYYLRNSRYGNPYKFKLPCPRTINPNYILPIFNLTQAQLTKLINGDSDSFTI